MLQMISIPNYLWNCSRSRPCAAHLPMELAQARVGVLPPVLWSAPPARFSWDSLTDFGILTTGWLVSQLRGNEWDMKVVVNIFEGALPIAISIWYYENRQQQAKKRSQPFSCQTLILVGSMFSNTQESSFLAYWFPAIGCT